MGVSFEKYINEDGLVAVLYSPGYGAGWYTWNTEHLGLLFDKDIVQAVLDGNNGLAADIAERKYPDAYTGGARDLKIKWLEPKTEFIISEYDGFESIVISGSDKFITA